MITSVPGASAYFKGGVVTYATQSKIDILGVPKELIENYSVVSAEVAETMAARAKEIFGTEYAVATTGNAGPAKGDADADVGTVYIGFATPQGIYSEKYELGQPREKVIDRASNKALEIIYQEILKN
jgi:nicotinamide-nucleotide amidase